MTYRVSSMDSRYSDIDTNYVTKGAFKILHYLTSATQFDEGEKQLFFFAHNENYKIQEFVY